MSETELQRLTAAAKRTIPQLEVNRVERDLRNAFRVWAPSAQTLNLASEAHRALFAELAWLRSAQKCRPFDEDAAHRPEVVSGVPETLASIVVKALVEHFTGGPEPDALSCCQMDDFGSMLSTDLHLLKIIDLNNETFWRRVVRCYSPDLLTYYEHNLNPKFDWKRQGVELKLAQLFERQDPRYWELEALEDTVKRVASFVENLTIGQLMPFPSVPPLEDYEAYRLCNTPDALCHHGSLAIVGHLQNLTTLSLVFGVKNWTKQPYRARYSKFSLGDVENLGIGLRKLIKLKSFTLSHSQLDPEKLAALVESLAHLPGLVTLNLSHCQLGRGCGAPLGRFLSRLGPTLKQLELSDNRLDALELDRLCPGLAVYQGAVDKLDLSYNPIGAEGVLILGGAIKGGPQLSELNFTGCLMGVEGSFRIIQLMSFHAPLRKVQLNCVPISPAGQTKLVRVLRENKRIEAVQIRECGVPERMQASVRRILTINAKLRMQTTMGQLMAQPATGVECEEGKPARSLASLYELRQKAFPISTTV